VHLLNYTTPDAQHGWLQEQEKTLLGPQEVAMKLPAGVRITSVELIRGGMSVPHWVDEGVLHFWFPSVGDYEIAAITVR
jgi:hypothetical protein